MALWEVQEKRNYIKLIENTLGFPDSLKPPDNPANHAYIIMSCIQLLESRGIGEILTLQPSAVWVSWFSDIFQLHSYDKQKTSYRIVIFTALKIEQNQFPHSFH